MHCNIPGQLEKTGLIRSETLSHNTGQTESISEFIHLSIQEFLGMAEISNRSDDVKSLLKKDTTDNESTLTKQFLFGLVFDTKNKWINAVKKALGWDETYDTEVREVAQKHVKALADYLRVAVSFCFCYQQYCIGILICPQEVEIQKEVPCNSVITL